MKIGDYLYQKDLYLSLGGKTHKPKEMSDSEWEILDRKALGAIRLSLASTIASYVSREKTIKDLMTTLSKIYEKLSASNKVFLMKKLFNLKTGDSGTVDGHLNEFNMLMSRLESAEINFEAKLERWLCYPVCRRFEMVL